MLECGTAPDQQSLAGPHAGRQAAECAAPGVPGQALPPALHTGRQPVFWGPFPGLAAHLIYGLNTAPLQVKSHAMRGVGLEWNNNSTGVRCRECASSGQHASWQLHTAATCSCHTVRLGTPVGRGGRGRHTGDLQPPPSSLAFTDAPACTRRITTTANRPAWGCETLELARQPDRAVGARCLQSVTCEPCRRRFICRHNKRRRCAHLVPQTTRQKAALPQRLKSKPRLPQVHRPQLPSRP